MSNFNSAVKKCNTSAVYELATILTGVGPELNLVRLVGRIFLVRVGRILLVRVGRTLLLRVGRTLLLRVGLTEILGPI